VLSGVKNFVPRRGSGASLVTRSSSSPRTRPVSAAAVVAPHAHKMSPTLSVKGKESGTARVLGSGTSGTCTRRASARSRL
jgi:hypothetical protein